MGWFLYTGTEKYIGLVYSKRRIPQKRLLHHSTMFELKLQRWHKPFAQTKPNMGKPSVWFAQTNFFAQTETNQSGKHVKS
jgi:hypothetical protein